MIYCGNLLLRVICAFAVQETNRTECKRQVQRGKDTRKCAVLRRSSSHPPWSASPSDRWTDAAAAFSSSSAGFLWTGCWRASRPGEEEEEGEEGDHKESSQRETGCGNTKRRCLSATKLLKTSAWRWNRTLGVFITLQFFIYAVTQTFTLIKENRISGDFNTILEHITAVQPPWEGVLSGIWYFFSWLLLLCWWIIKSQIKKAPHHHLTIHFMPSDWDVVLGATNVPHSKCEWFTVGLISL